MNPAYTLDRREALWSAADASFTELAIKGVSGVLSGLEDFLDDHLSAIGVKSEIGLASSESLRVVDLLRIDANGHAAQSESL